ncbi:MAG: universal stress protein [Steroidobacteraceae bacterium]|jgi:universal stress protein E|nr:universal stress protein [Steroidobacteraceae bacterium]
MASIRRILVAVKDPSARRQAAVEKAAQLATGLGVPLELFHALSEPLYVDAALMAGKPLKQLENEWRGRNLERLEKLAEGLRADGLAVSTACEWDHPAFEAVIRRAQRSRSDLIVAERHATRHLAPWLLRFNDWELLRRSPVPVLLVKSGAAWDRPAVLAAIDPAHAYAKPAKLDAAILGLGGAVAKALGGKLHAVHAFVPTLLDVRNLDLDDPNLSATIEARAAAQARAAFDKALAGSDVPAPRRHLLARHPVDAIPEAAKQVGAGLVVMGAVSRSGLKRLIVGDTAEQILDSLARDVLVVKPAHFKARVPSRRRGVQMIASPSIV